MCLGVEAGLVLYTKYTTVLLNFTKIVFPLNVQYLLPILTNDYSSHGAGKTGALISISRFQRQPDHDCLLYKNSYLSDSLGFHSKQLYL